MLSVIMYTLFIIACLILIGVVLLQSGKADAAAVFGGGGQAAFGPRSTTTLLQKITIGAAVTFMFIAFLFSLGVGGARSAAGGIRERPAAKVPEPAKKEEKKEEKKNAGSPQSTPAESASPAAAKASEEKKK